jgi:uncharacterized protein (DUF433 family)
MTLTLAADPLPLRRDSGGTYRVGPTRVRLDSVVYLHNQGSSAAQIVREYPSLELADVYAVISYYLRHKTEVDAYIATRLQEAAALQAEIEAKPQNQELRSKLIARRNQRS